MRDPVHDARVAVREPLVGIALVTGMTVAFGAVAWVLSLVVATIF